MIIVIVVISPRIQPVHGLAPGRSGRPRTPTIMIIITNTTKHTAATTTTTTTNDNNDIVRSGSCRCAITGVPWCLRRLSISSIV